MWSWVYECKHARQGIDRARANFTAQECEDAQAQGAYDALYLRTAVGLTNGQQLRAAPRFGSPLHGSKAKL